jgi:hypothetical protein
VAIIEVLPPGTAEPPPGTVDAPPGTGELSLRLIDAATAWIDENAADRGLPGLL